MFSLAMASLAPASVTEIFRRQSDSSADNNAGQELLNLLGKSYVPADKTFLASIGTALPLAFLVSLLFCFLRPHNNVVYAPRAKHADSKHAPPRISKGLLAWIPVLLRTSEEEIVEKVGLDAAVFLRVGRMLRNMFLVLAVVGCGILIPVAVVATKTGYETAGVTFFNAITPQGLSTSPKGTSLIWAYVVVAYLFTLIIFFFLWTNYRAVHKMRRSYFDSQDYRRSLHSRTLLVTDIPKQLRSDEGIVKLVDELRAASSNPHAAVARNVKDLPELIEEHNNAVRQLEKILAKYLKNPDHLPANRPMCKPAKRDTNRSRGQKVDAIDYLTGRIKELEIEVKHVREAVDKRNALPYGFASYDRIADAHTAAYLARKSGPHGTEIRLAPQPNDLVWKNLKMSKRERGWENFINNVWITLLTIAFIPPNILIAVFLSNLNNLGSLWPGFQQQLDAHRNWWAVVQAVVAPAITTLFYFFLPAIFRRLCVKAGDVSKTSRDRHVMHKLYAFLVVNQLVVFSVFSAIFGYATTLIQSSQKSTFKEAFEDPKNNGFILSFNALIGVSTYWTSWLLQRQLGSAIDLSQLVSLSWGSLTRKWGSPTPRETIELTAPQPFEYSAYYNYLLLYTTVALFYAPIQPLVLPIVALYFSLDCFFKKYLLMYVFITKYESGGMFWRSIVNRVLAALLLSYVVLALMIIAVVQVPSSWHNWTMLISLAPLFILVAGFKWYCLATFDTPIHFYSIGKALLDNEFSAESEPKRHKNDRVGVRFGNPVLYKPLITPMVAAKSQHLLKSIYSGRIMTDDNQSRAAGYSDVYMDAMDAAHPGKSASPAPFEFVPENQMTFDHYKNRPEFRDQAGGNGQLFGRAADMTRPGTPGSMSMLTRTASNDSYGSHQRGASDSNFVQHSRGVSDASGKSQFMDGGVEYPRGYHQTASALRDQSPAGSERSYDGSDMRFGFNHPGDARSREALVGHAAHMGLSVPAQINPYASSTGTYTRIGEPALGASPMGTPGEEDTSYDYFRRGRNRY